MSGLIQTKRNGNDKAATTRFNLLPTFPSWMDDMFNKNLGSEFMSNFNTGLTLPSVNVLDSADDFIVEMAVPGMQKSDFDINVDNKLLTISAETNTDYEDNNDKNYTRREFGYSSFKRTFSLPESVESDKISAKYVDGILKVVLPKREEAKKKPARNIKIS